MASRRHTVSDGLPPLNVKAPAQHETTSSPTIAGTPSISILEALPLTTVSRTPSWQSSSSRFSPEPSEKLDPNFRRRTLHENSDISADESDGFSWKGKQKEGSPSPSNGTRAARLTSGDDFLTPILTSLIDHWEAAHRIAAEYDRSVLENWKDELEKCLIIVGLCSASAAGFAIQYLCAFNPGPQVAIARFLSLDTSITDASPGPAGPPPGPSVPISISWVLSLVVSLGTVVVGITCLQWIREYLSDSRLGPKEGLAFRQMRYDGLMFWKVPFIISILPTLLLFSILLFFHGLMLFLYSLNKVVAIVIAAPVGIVWVFMTFATMLPALQCIFMSEERVRGHQCPYKSPQARLFAWFAFWFSVLVIRMLRGLGWKAEFLQKKQTFLENLIEGGLDWVSFDTTWQHERLMVPSDKSQEREGKDIAQAMAWLSRTGTHSVQGIHALYSSLRDVHPATALETIRKLVPGDYISDFSLQCGHDHRHDVVLKDLIGAVLLGYSVRNNHQLQRPFFDHRVELFIRIANSLVVGILGEELRDTRALVEKYFTPPFTGAVTIISPFSKDQDYAEVPNGYKHQLLITFNAHLKASTAALRPLPWALWDIVRPMVAQIVKGYPSPASDKYLQTELHIVNKELEAYFRHISMAVKQGESWELVRSARMSLIEYRDQFFTQGVVVQSIERRFPDFWEALKSLESAVIEASAPSPSRFSTTSRSETLVARVY